jgi:hypothetical protein
MQDDPPEDVEDEFGTVSAKDSRSVLPGDASGIFEDEVNLTDVGSVSREAGGPFGTDYAKMTFWEFLFGVDDVKAWDVDLGEFLNEVEEDPDAATTLGTVLKQSDVKPWDVDLGEFLKNLYLYSVKFLYEQPVSTIVAGLAFVCLLVAAVSLVFLISMFLGYV